MHAMQVFRLLTDGGNRTQRDKHYECRDCGANLSVDADECSECGGEVAVYTL